VLWSMTLLPWIVISNLHQLGTADLVQSIVPTEFILVSSEVSMLIDFYDTIRR
jgi:hypothetical protein